MPSPLIHTAVGLAAARVATGSGCSWPTMALFVFLANLPDLDLLPGILAGDPIAYHHHFTHSVSFALGVSLIAGLVAWQRQAGAAEPRSGTEYARRCKWLFLVSVSHPLMDLFGYQNPGQRSNPDIGITLLWPFSSVRTYMVSPIFEAAYLSADWREWFTAANLRVFAVDAGIAAVFVAMAWFLTRRPVSQAQPRGLPATQ